MFPQTPPGPVTAHLWAWAWIRSPAFWVRQAHGPTNTGCRALTQEGVGGVGSPWSPICGQSEWHRLTHHSESLCHCCGSHLPSLWPLLMSVPWTAPHGQFQAPQDPGWWPAGLQVWPALSWGAAHTAR